MTIDDLLIQVRSPIRYLDRELNACRKDPAEAKLTAALCFPDLYETGISHLGHQLLYHILNGMEGVSCDRSYAPWPDLAALLKQHGLELYGWESKRPLKQFDLVGFTLPNELCYSNVLFMLDLAGIPLQAAQRRGGSWLSQPYSASPCCFISAAKSGQTAYDRSQTTPSIPFRIW